MNRLTIQEYKLNMIDEIQIAIRDDLESLVGQLSLRYKSDFKISLWSDKSTDYDIRDIFLQASDFIFDDEMWIRMTGEDEFSHHYGIRVTFDLYSVKREIYNRKSAGLLDHIDHSQIQEMKLLTKDAIASQVALMSRGLEVKALDIYKTSAVLAEMLRFEREGGLKPIADYTQNLTVVKGIDYIIKFLKKGDVPTKKMVFDKFKENEIDKSYVSRQLSRTKIWSLLPSATNAGPNRARVKDFQEEVSVNLLLSTEDDLDFISGEPLLEFSSPNILSNYDPYMSDRDIFIIKERLGPLYKGLLFQFGLGELSDQKSIREFESKIEEFGLGLLIYPGDRDN